VHGSRNFAACCPEVKQYGAILGMQGRPIGQAGPPHDPFRLIFVVRQQHIELRLPAWLNQCLALVLAVGSNERQIERMFSRLTKSNRIRLGWLVALAYLVCVVAPGAALALGTGPAPCFDEFVPAGQAHVHADGTVHDHGGMHAHHADAGGAIPEHSHDGKTSTGPCCAMLCLSAMPADLPAITKPSPPTFVVVAEVCRRLTSKTSPLPYRPPNA
jgi:hypothetical protein